MEFRELECFIVLSEELHFARTAERLYLSPGRVSQLLRSLETRIGGRLFDRTSRRVRLTPLGERFLADLRPAYDGMAQAVTRARAAAREVTGVIRVGFLATPTDVVTGSVRAFERRNPGCAVELVEIPLSDPFSKLRAGLVDIAFTLLPVDEPDLATGEGLNHVSHLLGVSVRHPLAGRAGLGVEELASVPLIGLDGPAPRSWHERMAPSVTPSGRPIPRAGKVATTQEGLTQVALNRGGMLFCTPTALQLARPDLSFVPVTGLPPSILGLAWLRARETAAIRAFNEAAVRESAMALVA
ncbi:LysR family transcriptional regulator [Nonomuraea gerenzanensis]|uniref:Chromosome initiation inhibitor n=1 Tax=Nonomuraea gerenzanensis TaxID=93944 RepID=A0A1M4ENI7_9ACTN|nr:LysR family transcriptional regulator [Nonomuraea gerenzanensis]UBU11879.1 LysR family transcriptional regulator [Nonomuraea gerenzanensis]SBP00390.1 Chromosome initiation inhibitor [Nonomuraea gerenzanensis]